MQCKHDSFCKPTEIWHGTTLIATPPLAHPVTRAVTCPTLHCYHLAGAADPETQCVNSDGFVQVMESIIALHAASRRTDGRPDWMWFGMYFDDEAESLPVYINAVDMALTYDKPHVFVSRVQDTESFEQVNLADGSVSGARRQFVSGNNTGAGRREVCWHDHSLFKQPPLPPFFIRCTRPE